MGWGSSSTRFFWRFGAGLYGEVFFLRPLTEFIGATSGASSGTKEYTGIFNILGGKKGSISLKKIKRVNIKVKGVGFIVIYNLLFSVKSFSIFSVFTLTFTIYLVLKGITD